MPPKKDNTVTSDTADSANGGLNLTPRDLEILTIAMKSNKADLAIDYNKMAEMGGFKTTASARTGWHNVRKKLGIELSSATGKGEGGDAMKTPVKGGNKRKNAAAEEVEADEESVATPAKKAKGGKKSKAKVDEHEEGENESEESAPAPKKGNLTAPTKKAKTTKKGKAEVEEGEDVEMAEVPAGTKVGRKGKAGKGEVEEDGEQEDGGESAAEEST